MRFGGAIELTTPEIQLKEPMKFTTMAVPAKKTDTFAGNNADKLYAWATLGQVRAHPYAGILSWISGKSTLSILPSQCEPGYGDAPLALGLRASLGRDRDRCRDHGLASRWIRSKDRQPELPEVIYDKSHSVLETSFDGCIDVKGVLVPKRLASSFVTRFSTCSRLYSDVRWRHVSSDISGCHRMSKRQISDGGSRKSDLAD
jgi:hypothetical protein